MNDSEFPFFDCDLIRDDEFGVVINAEGLPRTVDIVINGEDYKATFYRERVVFERGELVKTMTITQLFDFFMEEEWGLPHGDYKAE